MSIMVGPLIDGGYGRLCFGGGGLMILAARGKCVVGDKAEQEGRKEGGKVPCSFSWSEWRGRVCLDFYLLEN